MNNYVENNYPKVIFTLNIMSTYEKIFNTTLKTCLKLVFENNLLQVTLYKTIRIFHYNKKLLF